MTHKPVIAWAILMLLVLSSLPAARLAFALDPGPDQTSLDVRQPGAQTQWGDSRTIHALHIVHFRWKTNVLGTKTGLWQIFDFKPQPNDMNAFSKGNAPLTMLGQFHEFTIDFVQLQQLNPSKIPANAPANGKDYYIRVETLDANEQPGKISDIVKITYVKSPPSPSNPLAFIYSAVFWTGGHFVDLGYGTNKAVIPVITVSTSAPVKNAQGNPVFSKHAKIVSTSIPFLAGYENDGVARLPGLTPKTHFHYIIMAKDEKGEVAYETGAFTTATRFVTVGFEKIFMIDDSDGFPSGAGDMNFAFFVNDVNVLGNKKTFPPKDPMDFSTGATQAFDNIFSTIKDPPNTVRVRVNGFDLDDCGNPFNHPFCDCISPGDVTDPHMKNSTCKDGSGENSAATATINIPDVTDRSQFGIEFLEKSFTMTADNGHLKFRVSGRFDVEFH